jgi:hypothetical protein
MRWLIAPWVVEVSMVTGTFFMGSPVDWKAPKNGEKRYGETWNRSKSKSLKLLTSQSIV